MFKIIGGIIGFFMGSWLGFIGMIFGAYIGSSLGRSVDSLIFGSIGSSSNNHRNEDAYRKFYEQFYQNTNNGNYRRGYAHSGEYGYNGFQNQGASDSCYAAIGCNRSDTPDQIKKSYRKIVSQYHPDRLAGKGLSDSEMLAAENKFKNIQEAYNQIKKEKGI
ncbi:MAG: hypothetical protein B6229_01575 [Spirochaetaceae bacterium 4572_7]|nr:MAG: hypothetical protein B6229_01575 [Spirochaetaceae bacterium 4572_7]